MAIKQISAKIGNMRKAEDFIVYPASGTPEPGPGRIIQIQSDHRIAQFNTATGRGYVSKYKSNGAYNPDLLPFLGAMPFVASAELIAAALDAQPKSGDEIGPGVRIA